MTNKERAWEASELIDRKKVCHVTTMIGYKTTIFKFKTVSEVFCVKDKLVYRGDFAPENNNTAIIYEVWK